MCSCDDGVWCDMHLAEEALRHRDARGIGYDRLAADARLAYEVDDPKHPDWVDRVLTWAESRASA